MSELKLGQILDSKQERDAIHIAVAPVVAAESLVPGSRIGFADDDTTERVSTRTKAVLGVVDPFLTMPVSRGQRFWMFLLPNTITSLRHDWTHPAFLGAAPAAPAVAESESVRWIRAFADELDQTYNRLMDAAHRWLDYDEGKDFDGYTYDNSETYKRVDHDKWPTFWRHFAIVTGKQVHDPERSFFTCSC